MKYNNIHKDQQFGDWIVLTDPYPLHKYEGYGSWFVKAKCKCEREVEVSIYTLCSGESKMCKTCSNTIRANLPRVYNYKLLGDFTSTHYRRIMRGAKERNTEFNVSMEYLWDLFSKQDGKCALSGMKITLLPQKCKNPKSHSKFVASLDRIDSSIGYVEGNLQWVHKWINIMKNILSNNEFIYLCKQVANFNHDNFEPSFENRDRIISKKVQRLTTEGTLPNNVDTSVRPLKEKGDDIV